MRVRVEKWIDGRFLSIIEKDDDVNVGCRNLYAPRHEVHSLFFGAMKDPDASVWVNGRMFKFVRNWGSVRTVTVLTNWRKLYSQFER